MLRSRRHPNADKRISNSFSVYDSASTISFRSHTLLVPGIKPFTIFQLVLRFFFASGVWSDTCPLSSFTRRSTFLRCAGLSSFNLAFRVVIVRYRMLARPSFGHYFNQLDGIWAL